MLKILHNPRCGKSRKWLEVLKKSGLEFEVIEYLKNFLTYDELVDLKNKLWLKAIDFTRVKEKEFKEAWLTKDSSDEEILKAMAKYPKLIERPIVFDDKKAVLWRPDPEEKIKEFLENLK